ncbi:hypothetical protein PMI36_03925 [Pseudomonas sp. GM79]|jgi:hypothetical protein|uniref:hypothetical protein n=1 Tax=Pseudomonas sp. GM79 TaxID=1144338 RepID=UPI00026F96D2|nr:hypothetical protein [Pseudomonas sp. GM79]EJN20861.1 hypothetical protein PMI36_03925 [Pseudomonas sp. GM79]
MKVTILRIIDSTALGTYVEFSTPYGVGSSLFAAPEIKEGLTYDVEINIDDDFFWNENIAPSIKHAPSIYFHSGKLHITAELISSEDDGCGALRIGDSIALISLNQAHYPLPMFVDISAKETSLHPTHI